MVAAHALKMDKSLEREVHRNKAEAARPSTYHAEGPYEPQVLLVLPCHITASLEAPEFARNCIRSTHHGATDLGLG